MSCNNMKSVQIKGGSSESTVILIVSGVMEGATNRPSPELRVLSGNPPSLRNKGKCEKTSPIQLGMQNAASPFT
ncbi:hypothetical protein T11_7042 [Trichinella zimbabwensis]|uniref:Uncharacterized protein n=1 Tax=Trichinella zimbabwensis TaxID=268475 RepID=A0A0V1HGC0_9BILA|nr:hypothetical protein T11_7042 [Trichinella zimbabwensis]